MARFLQLETEKMHAFTRLLDQVGLTAEMAEECLADKKIAKARFAAFAAPPVSAKPPVRADSIKRNRWRRVNATTIRVNLDFAPISPFKDSTDVKHQWRYGWGVVTVKMCDDKLYQDGREMVLRPISKMKDSRWGPLCKELNLSSLPHPNIMDAVIEASLVPESWKVGEDGYSPFIHFLGVGFYNGFLLRSRYMHWLGSPYNVWRCNDWDLADDRCTIYSRLHGAIAMFP